MDQEAQRDFADFVAARHPMLVRRAYLLTGNQADAEDLVQTTLAKTYRAWDRIREREAVDAYVRRIMVNTRTSWLRRPFRENPTHDVPERGIADHADEIDARDALRRALLRLPKKQRAAVVLRFYEDLSERGTAEALGVAVGTVKSSVSRALERLRTDPSLAQHLTGEPVPAEDSYLDDDLRACS